MTYMWIKSGCLEDVIDLTYLEGASMIIAALCHDVEHDGYTNAYHVNAGTERALRYHDQAVQENWHASIAVRFLQ